MENRFALKIFYPIVILAMFSTLSYCGGKKFVKVREMNAPEARQGVAVDANYIYVIGTREIAKYDKKSGELVASWKGEENGQIIHLDSGVIIDGKLYCAHSNYPAVPMTSSVEIWDAETLEHIGNHSFGIRWGSCTWVDSFNGRWYASFAQYGKWVHLTGKDASWTTVVQFDNDWNESAAWVFPKEVVEKFGKMSNSGGSWGPDGLLYCTGHDDAVVYAMKLPKAGSILELVEILPIDIYGQGIAWDRSEPYNIYGIVKKDRRVVVSKLIAQ